MGGAEEQVAHLKRMLKRRLIDEPEFVRRSKAILDQAFGSAPAPVSTADTGAARRETEAETQRRIDEAVRLALAAQLKAAAAETAKAVPGSVPGVEFGDYHALVIGNNDYEFLPNLVSAEADAQAVAKVLRDHYGFKTEVLLNASRRDIFRALGAFRRKLGEDDSLLIYYGGHGILDEQAERGYWLPVDAEEDIKSSWISNADITDELKALDAWHVLVMTDSCYSGTLARSIAAPVAGGGDRNALIERLAIKKSRTVLSSGGLEPVVDGGGDGHSAFARAFLSILADNEGVLETQRLFTALREKVTLNADQTPEYADVRKAGHDGGDFIFVRRR